MAIEHTIKMFGQDIFFQCKENEAVLAAMKRSGAKTIAAGCFGGGCGVCKVKLISGAATYKTMSRAHISTDEEGRGIVLACCMFPKSDIELEFLG
ncbi:MAG: 2Fe-2S iron-sulfur cluster-binding protein [Eubacteriaceae bacterium]|nr:2Fe-2S iron-sulfur cluster-binding protein [Eubacteriaceae bacterium]